VLFRYYALLFKLTKFSSFFFLPKNISTTNKIGAVFRTNTSYQRWDEARKNWGMNINRTRDLVRQANVYYDDTNVSPEQRKDDLRHTALCTWAFVRAMKRHLSPEEEDEDMFCQELYEKLPAQQAEMIIGAAHRPNRALQDLSYAIDDLPMHFLRKNEIHKSLTNFEDNLGSSERLLTSPVPLFYSRHLARFLAIWLLLLPFALYDTFAASWNHIGMIPATAVISIFLFGIEELGTQLEEPFTILPMQAFCDKIYNWCTEIVKWTPGDNGRPMKPVRIEHSSFMPGAAMPGGGQYYAPPPSTNMNGDMNGGYYNPTMNTDLSGFNEGYYMDPAPPGAAAGTTMPPGTPPQPSSTWASNANGNTADSEKMSFTEFLQRQGKPQ
jgi:predicted membrane chloride channel (bestrophin family)